MTFFVLRTILFTFVRFALLMGLVVFSQSFEVSPLPEWTLYLFVFLAQFLVTFVCAAGAIHRHLPRSREWIILLVFFLLGETLFEVQLLLWLSRGTWSELSGVFAWKTLIPLISYFIAVTLAVRYKQRKLLQAHLPEGVSL